MPDFGNLAPSVLKVVRWSDLKPHYTDPCLSNGFREARAEFLSATGDNDGPETVNSGSSKSLKEYVSDWVQRKIESGHENSRAFLPFLVGAKKMGECLICRCSVSPEQRLPCSVRSCDGVFHFTCAKRSYGRMHLKKLKCPQHECFLCKQKFHWKCVRCAIASHDKCAPWAAKVIHLKYFPGRAVCWKHKTDWRLEIKNKAPTSDFEDVFDSLPLPYTDEDFHVDFVWKESKNVDSAPPSYIHIKRNIYLIKKKREELDFEVGCSSCISKCCEDCVCRSQCISCSKACKCSDACSNRPFRKGKKTKLVKTAFCGWGVVAAELINKKDFVVEYIGEVIDDALCEQRLWDMKYRGEQNFYMCEIRKDFTIDATFKGNISRFLNHSCDPNCILEKWQVEGETRVGVFAARDIKSGEPLTYDYRFVQFGADVKCHCGSSNCQGFLGTKKKMCQLSINWGAKRRRSTVPTLNFPS